MEQPVFQTRGLCYGGILAYDDLTIPHDQVTFIQGESGCGKSTLLRLLNGTLQPCGGQILCNGEDIERMDTIALRRKVSLVSQGVYLFDGSIRDNFRLYCQYRGEAAPDDGEITKFLALCCIPFDPSQDCVVLSGGERQRVYLSIYLSLKPEVLLLDEPTAALDHKTGQEVLGNVLGFCREQCITPIAVSHDGELAARFAEDVIELQKEGTRCKALRN
jgi:putative ABC transport system ATP-binding protein